MRTITFGKPLSRLITLVAICMLSLHAMAYDLFSYTHQGNTLFYNITSDNTVEVWGLNSVSGAVVIPSSVTNNGTTYSVTSIGDEAFYLCSGLTSVTIPNSVTSIGDYVFYCCSSLTSVTIGNSVTSIGDYAFISCSGLTSVTIGNSVTSIGDYAFEGCSSLTSVTIGNSVTSIGYRAFYECSGLTSVTIPNSVTSIGQSAFAYCSGLTSVTIPNSVTSIGNSAFAGCSSLTSVTIPNSVTSIGWYAFASCSSLTSVTIPNSVTLIASSAFEGCSSLTSVTIGNSVTSIGDYSFYGCSSLTSIVSKATVPPVLGNEVFSNPNNCNVTVPCGSLLFYMVSSWNNYFPYRITEGLSFDLSVAANDDSSGSVSVETQSCNVITLTATPSSCKSFVAWNDGNADNPRTVTITSDTSFTAIFESVEISNDITAAICQGETYTENGFNVSEAGVYTQNLQTINGCDSIVTLTLTVNPVATTNLNAAICQGETYTENGFNVSEAGVYTQNLQTINGCDSIVTLTLTVNPVYSFTIDATINQGETYHGNGFEVSEAGTYTQNLQTVNGCDSVIVLNLTVNSSLGDVVANTIEVALYPNPAENYTVLEVQGLKEQTKVALFDVRGRKLREFDLSACTESVRLDLRDLPSGVYTLMIGNTTKKLIVE